MFRKLAMASGSCIMRYSSRNSQLIGPSLIPVHVLQTRNASRTRFCYALYSIGFIVVCFKSTVIYFGKSEKMHWNWHCRFISYCKGYSGVDNSIQILWVDLFVKQVSEGINK